MPTDPPPLVLLGHLIRDVQEKSECPQEPARTIFLTLSLPGLSFTPGILEGKYKEKLVE